ncbi:sialidase-3 isoform X2 [Cuculus canorus]|uniref:sialidase-3 isoform X2 n=1 Tax=Cuculus canorus TaxID=55661 RepID=UPI0023AA2C39|nr:sialidase-3 isoform X2 [Cuculus canorus]
MERGERVWNGGAGPSRDLEEATMSQPITCLKQGVGRESPCLPSPPTGSPLIFLQETLFQQKSGVTYRIPALLYIPPTATLLAFAEKRSSAKDEDAKYLVLRRGCCCGSSVEWGPMEELSTLVLPHRRTMNPCPLYDATSGTIFLFCICVERGKTERCQILRGCSAARLCFATSTNSGRSWTPLQDVTNEAIGTDLSRWATFAVGPGHGVQLDSGRLVVPAYTYYMHKCLCGLVPLPCYTRQHALVFYSDDSGRSWHKGDLVGGEQTGECQVAEINGSNAHQPVLYCNARALRGCRVEAFSTDRGLGFEHSEQSKVLGEPPRGCQGSVVSFTPPASTRDAETWLLYSHPTDRHHRRDLGIYLNPSPLDVAGWQHPWVLHPGPAGYSDLAVCPDGIFGCLFECGTTSACEEIVFCLFTLKTSDCGEENPKAS